MAYCSVLAMPPKREVVVQIFGHDSTSPKVALPVDIHHQQSVMTPTSGPCAFGHDMNMKNLRSVPQPVLDEPTEIQLIQVLIADSGPIQSQLLSRALRGRREFEVATVDLDTTVLRNFLQSNHVDVVLVAGNHLPDLSLLRWLRVSYPKIAPVLLVENDDRELVVNALRAGAKGIFLFTQTPFPMLCKCIHCVFDGEVWVNNQQMNYVLDALSDVPTLRVVSSTGRSLLTPREEQVVALVADGLTNRGVASELGLSEHTIKKYLLRIFDKVGISSRVELVLYALSHGEHRPAEWMPSSNA
jgi:DNA-binding NarL/FixJ family response regulator